MNFVDAIDRAREWAVEFDRLIYVQGIYRDSGITYEQCWQPDLTNLAKFHTRPVWRVWPDGTVQVMGWTPQEIIPNV